MSRLDNIGAQIPAKNDRNTIADIIRAICTQSNVHAEGRISGRYTANSVVPSGSAVSYAVGDISWNSNPTVVSGTITGSLVGSYVVLGWVCTAPGSPGTQKELRIPTV